MSVVELVLPAGMTATKAWSMHSQPDLLTCYGLCNAKQVVPHHGISDYSHGISDGSMGALLTATSASEMGGNLTELDVLWINGEPYVMHDLTGDQQSLNQGPCQNFTPQLPGKEMQHFIIQNVKGAQYTENYITTNFLVTELIPSLWRILEQNSQATLFLDAQAEDGAKLTAFLSHHPTFFNNALIQIYPYTNRTGEEFVGLVDRLGPGFCWKHTISIVPVLNADMLPRLAGVMLNSLDYQCLFEAGQNWFSSMIDADMNIFGLGIPASGIGHYFNLVSQLAHDLDGNVVDDPTIKAMFLWDRVLLDLIVWAREKHPIFPIIGVSITYSHSYDGQRYTNNFHTGYPDAWPAGAESHGKELMAIPGNPFKLGADIVICDRPVDNLNVLLETKTYSWPNGVNYPALNGKQPLVKMTSKL